MKKAYCKDCKHCKFIKFVSLDWDFICDINPYYVDDWDKRNLRYVKCEIRNKNNDCKYFEKKEPEPEKTKLPKEPPLSWSWKWWKK